MESLYYFHPASEGMYQKNAARRHWWENAGLLERELPAKEREAFFLLVDCPVPPYYYKKNPWPAEVLSACMTEKLLAARGMAGAWLHPDIMTQLSDERRKQWEPGQKTLERLAACLIFVYAADCLMTSGEATVFLGPPSDTMWQMELTARLLAPYLPRINSLTFRYEEEEGADLWEEASDCLEAYSYEYGLTPCLLPYRTDAGGRTGAGERGGLILDYGSNAGVRRPKDGKRAVYVDLLGSPIKERKCLAADGRILYVSPLKYLDTAVKSEYDKKMYAMVINGAAKREQ